MKKLSALILLLSLCVTLFSCGAEGNTGPKNKYTSDRYYGYLDTVCYFIGYEYRKAEFDATVDDMLDILARYHKLCDIYNEYTGMNNLATLNREAGSWVTLPGELIEFLTYCVNVYALTGGKVNIAFGAVTEIWHTFRTDYLATLPTDEELNEAALHCDITMLEIDKENGRARLNDPDMRLDVGAIAKGYIAELCAEYLQSTSKTGYAINLGGNIRTVGDKPDGRWVLGVSDPGDLFGGERPTRVYASDTSLVTSGSYQRSFEYMGVNYHHLISPDTLYPADTFVSVSVLTRHSGLADALSTALFVCPTLTEALNMLGDIPDTEAFFIFADGSTAQTKGWSAYEVTE